MRFIVSHTDIIAERECWNMSKKVGIQGHILFVEKYLGDLSEDTTTSTTLRSI